MWKISAPECAVTKLQWVAVALLVLVAGFCGGLAQAKEIQRTCPMGREYFLYVPDDYGSSKTYWLVVGVHGYGGTGKLAGSYSGWIDKGNVIVVGPSFPNEGYQILAKESDQQLIGLFKQLQKEFRLYPKMFVAGFSGGAQFAHRFTLKYPELIVGCAAHSAGTWNDNVNAKAAAVPMAISCGEDDKAKSTSDARMSRIDWAKTFAKKLRDADFYCKIRFWSGVPHRFRVGGQQLSEDCFYLSTTGMHKDQGEVLQKEFRDIMAAGQYAKALAWVRKLPSRKIPPGGPHGAPKVAEPAPGNSLPGLQEDAYGWHENAAGRAALEAMQRFYLGELSKSLVREIEKAGLKKVAAIEKDKPADAVAQLEGLLKQFKSQYKITAAITAALNKMKKPAAGK